MSVVTPSRVARHWFVQPGTDRPHPSFEGPARELGGDFQQPNLLLGRAPRNDVEGPLNRHKDGLRMNVRHIATHARLDAARFGGFRCGAPQLLFGLTDEFSGTGTLLLGRLHVFLVLTNPQIEEIASREAFMLAFERFPVAETTGTTLCRHCLKTVRGLCGCTKVACLHDY